jgi:hypothetical protein
MPHPGGRPRKFSSPDDMWSLYENYQEHCTVNGLAQHTLGFSVYVGMSREGLYNYGDSYPEYSDTLKKISESIEADMLQKAYNRKQDPVFTMFMLKCKHGYIDKVTIDDISKDKIDPAEIDTRIKSLLAELGNDK